MEKFRKKMKRRIRCLWGLLFLLLVVMVAVGELSNRDILLDPRKMTEFAQNMQQILFFGTLIWVICRLVRDKKLLEDSFALQQKQIEEQDECLRTLDEKSGGPALRILILFMGIGTFCLSWVDMPAFYTSFAFLAAAVAVRAGFYYYNKSRLYGGES